jgi:ribulose-phosphate 3-epimerase
MIQIAPSLLSCDFKKMGEELRDMTAAGADFAHLDVMDGMFVTNITFGIPVIASLRSASDIVFDVHLMIEKPERYIERFATAGADIITVHYEACEDVGVALNMIRACGKKAGLSIKPNTPAEVVLPYLDLVDMILVMTVEPGYGGQALIGSCLDKVRAIKTYANEHGRTIPIEVDGGINEKTAPVAIAAGADILVAGSYVFGATDRAAAIEKLRNA